MKNHTSSRLGTQAWRCNRQDLEALESWALQSPQASLDFLASLDDELRRSRLLLKERHDVERPPAVDHFLHFEEPAPRDLGRWWALRYDLSVFYSLAFSIVTMTEALRFGSESDFPLTPRVDFAVRAVFQALRETLPKLIAYHLNAPWENVRAVALNALGGWVGAHLEMTPRLWHAFRAESASESYFDWLSPYAFLAYKKADPHPFFFDTFSEPIKAELDKIRDTRRKKGKENRWCLCEGDLQRAAAPERGSFLELQADPRVASDPIHAIVCQETRNQTERFLEALPVGGKRDTGTDCLLHGLTPAESARLRGKTAGQARVELHRVLQELRRAAGA